MKKFYLLRTDIECKVTDKILTIWSDIFYEEGDRIEILSRELRKNFKNIKVGDDVICFDPQNIELIYIATVIENSCKERQGLGIKSRCIILEKTCKKITFKNMCFDDELTKFIEGSKSNLSLIEIEKNIYLKFLSE